VVIATVTFGVAQAVAAVDVRAFSGAFAGSIAVQHLAGGVWLNLDGVAELKTVARTRRFAAPPRAPVLATDWRVAVTNLAGSGAVTIGEVAFWAEGSSFDTIRLRPFKAGDGSVSDHAWMPGHAEVYNADGRVASYAVPHAAGNLAELKTIQQLDTMLGFEKNVAPHRVFRQGADTEWDSAPAPLINLPLVDYGDAYVNGVAAKWQLQFFGVPVDGTANQYHWVFTLAGEETATIVPPLSGALVNWPAFAALIKPALEDLPGVAPGLTVASPGSNIVTVEFTVGEVGQ
jgi:hypothetical protein